jgi:hypothetical protein
LSDISGPWGDVRDLSPTFKTYVKTPEEAVKALMDPLKPSEEPHKRTRRRSCSANCLNAKGPKCACICGGVNHGRARISSKEERDKEQVKTAEDIMREDDKAEQKEIDREVYRLEALERAPHEEVPEDEVKHKDLGGKSIKEVVREINSREEGT